MVLGQGSGRGPPSRGETLRGRAVAVAAATAHEVWGLEPLMF